MMITIKTLDFGAFKLTMMYFGYCACVPTALPPARLGHPHVFNDVLQILCTHAHTLTPC